MVISANQQYKKSGSKLPFKLWLSEEQNAGNLEIKEKMLNLTGTEKKSKPANKMRNLNIIGIVAICFLAFGLYQVSKTEVE